MPKGTLLIRAAEQIGIQIPRFCDHPLLDPAGACRQCLVEVTDMGNGRGMPKPAASCTTTVMPGMVIKTQLTSPVADKAQQGVMELLLINHPLDCPVCDKGGECPLQNQAMSNGRADSRFADIKRTFPKPIAVSSQVLLDRERCVLCQRCTRFSEQIAGDPFIDLLERGAQQQIGTVDRHPVPVLLLRQHRADLPGRRADRCQLPFPGPAVRPDVDAERVRALLVRLRASAPTGGAARSPGGWPARTPRSTRSGTATRAGGPSTYADPARPVAQPAGPRRARPAGRGVLAAGAGGAAAGLAAARDGGGVGVLPGGRLTEEDAYAYAKFARVALGTNDIDFRARPNSAEELAFLGAAIAGTTPQTGGVSYADLETRRHRPAGRPGARGGVADRLPAAAQGRSGRPDHGVLDRARWPRAGWPSSTGLLIPTVPGAEAAALARPGRRAAPRR